MWRYRKPAHPLTYIEAADRFAETVVPEAVADGDLAFEFMLNALRLNDGFAASLFAERTGQDPKQLSGAIDRAMAHGLLEGLPAGGFRPTRTGRRFLNDLQALFLP